MPASKQKQETGVAAPVRRRVNELLADIRRAKGEHDKVARDWDAAIKELERQYSDRAKQAKDRVKALEKELEKHAKKHRDELFADGADRAVLANGVLIWSVSERVKRAKAVTVDRLKELGFTDGIRVEEKVHWDTLETWTDERLIAAGTERVRKEAVEYELYGGQNSEGS